MPSIRSYIFPWVLWLTAKSTCQSPGNLQAALYEDRQNQDPAPPKELYDQFKIEKKRQHEYDVYTLSPNHDEPIANVLYLHGGGFIFNMTKAHWNFVAAITERLNATVTVPIYPLGPETELLGIYEAVQPLYNELAAAATPEKPFWCGGDSAGGTMTIHLTRRATDSGLPRATRMFLISPCVDYSCTNPHMFGAAKKDPWLDIPGILEMKRLVCPDLSAKDPRLSPIYGNLVGFPPILVFAGGADLLTSDTKKFVEMAREQGNEVEFHEEDGMVHIWPVMPIPEAKVAIEQMAKWLL